MRFPSYTPFILRTLISPHPSPILPTLLTYASHHYRVKSLPQFEKEVSTSFLIPLRAFWCRGRNVDWVGWAPTISSGTIVPPNRTADSLCTDGTIVSHPPNIYGSPTHPAHPRSERKGNNNRKGDRFTMLPSPRLPSTARGKGYHGASIIDSRALK